MESTPQRLIEAATQGFADHGIQTASLVEITRQAGQRNRGAVHYHFGGRDGLLVAVLEQHADFLGQRERELLAVARERPADDLASAVEAVVRPAVELVEQSTSGSNYLVIVTEVTEQDPASYSPEIEAVLARTGGYEVYALMRERMPEMDDDLRAERFALMTSFVLGAVARRARQGAATNGRAELSTPRFVANLVAMASAMLSAPPVDE